jgi:hypothetical protein
LVSSYQSPLLNHNNNKVSIINKATVVTNVSRTTRNNTMKPKPGMIHTKYDTTSTQSNITIAQPWDSSEILISKYAAMENHVTGIPKVLKSSEFSPTRPKISAIPNEVLKACEFSQMGSKILITHENLTQFHMPQTIKNANHDKPSTTKTTMNKVLGTGMNTK